MAGSKKKSAGIRRYTKYIKPYWPYFTFGPILMLTEVAGDVIMPSIVKSIIDTGVAAHDVGYIISKGITMVLLAFVMMFGGVGGNYFSAKASSMFSRDLRKDIFAKIQGFSFKNVDDFSTGSLVTRLTNDITQIQNVMRMGLVMLLRSPGMLIGALIMAVRISGALATVIAAVIPLLAISIFLIMRTAFPRFTQMQQKIDSLNTGVQENITNMRVIKSFLRADFEESKFKKANSDLKESTLGAMRVVIATMPVMTIAMNLTTIAVVWFGGNFVIKGTMEVGSLTAFTTYIVQILMSLMMLSMIFLQSSRAIASVKRINEVMDTEVDLNDENASCPEKTVTAGSVEFRNVSFKYREENAEDILSGIDLKIDAGEVVGVIGPTGCGKTSLVQLIPRLYDVNAGEVIVDGTDVRDYSIKNLREGVGMVLQKNVLFSGTIEENLRWGDENADMDALRAAADAAQADGFISDLTNGYQTELGQGGVNVSGGQKQRLCIARALLKKPKILILDDSTSAVDSATDAKIREMLKTQYKDTTKIIIAQRIQSVIDADKIVIIDDGRIVGVGTHAELMQSSAEYREIYYSQTDGEVSA